jgi:hypothetical protein
MKILARLGVSATALAMAVLSWSLSAAPVADDWPSIYGPNRNNTSAQTGIIIPVPQAVAHYSTNERNDGLVVMAMDGTLKWKTNQQLAFARGGSILADGLMLVSDGSTKLNLLEPSPEGVKAISSAVVLEPGDNWAPLALADGKLLIRGQRHLKVLQVAQ